MRPALLSLFLAFCPALRGQDIPRPEYPQPQFQREEWLNLNGRWSSNSTTRTSGWPRIGRRLAQVRSHHRRAVRLREPEERHRRPGVFTPWSGIERDFTVAGGLEGPRVLLQFGAVDYRARSG